MKITDNQDVDIVAEVDGAADVGALSRVGTLGGL